MPTTTKTRKRHQSPKRAKTATHRPATRRRRFRHDTPVAVDLFSGFGGLTKGIELAGFEAIMCANHNQYKTEVHERNHPHAEHWIADLVDPESGDYHDVRALPRGDLLVAGVTCTNHSPANTQKAYEQKIGLFELDDPDFDARVTRSEKDRATANCVLAYADQHNPRMMLIECTTELTSWGPALPDRPNVGDGTTFRWWLKTIKNLHHGYKHKILYLNSMFFGVGQSRDRLYIVFWDSRMPAPDLEHRPVAWCGNCSDAVESVWTWRTGVPPTGRVCYGQQYNYRCPRCRRVVVPTMTPSLGILDLSNLGTRIGDKPVKTFKDGFVGPMARATMARAERCRTKFPDFPAILMPAKAAHGVERHILQPMSTQTSQQETAVLSAGSVALTGQVLAAHRHNGDGKHISEPMDTVTSTHEKALLVAVHNHQGISRGVDQPLPTQTGSETLGVMSAGILPFRQHTVPTTHGEPMSTVTADQIPGLLTAAGTIRNNGGVDQAEYRAHPVSDPLGTVVASGGQGLLFSGWYKQNGTGAAETAAHPLSDPFGTLTARDTTGLLMAEWQATLAGLALEDCYFRMLGPHEVGRGCGFDTTYPGHIGEFQVWGSARDQVDGFGNAVSPQVGEWIGLRLRAVLDTVEPAA